MYQGCIHVQMNPMVQAIRWLTYGSRWCIMTYWIVRVTVVYLCLHIWIQGRNNTLTLTISTDTISNHRYSPLGIGRACFTSVKIYVPIEKCFDSFESTIGQVTTKVIGALSNLENSEPTSQLRSYTVPVQILARHAERQCI